nr:Outer membrane flp protein [Klebsiella pneumoniae]
MGGKTDLTTANFNLSGAYRLDSNWSFGLGFDAVYAKAKIERYAGDLGQIVAGSGALPPALAGQVAKIRPTRRSPILMATRGASAGTPGSSMSWIRITATV